MNVRKALARQNIRPDEISGCLCGPASDFAYLLLSPLKVQPKT
jgi:hypothetical protein